MRSSFLSRIGRTLFPLLLVLTMVAVAVPVLPSQTAYASSNERAVAAVNYAVYSVQSGDTLSAIAVRTGSSVSALVSLNRLVNANQIRVGQSILVPAAVESRGNTTTYTVRRNDTLYSLARTYNTTVGVLMWLNGITNPNSIRIGQVLTVPGTGSTSGATPTRIRFPAGGTSATVTGAIRVNERQCYVFGALAGQTATLSITSTGNAANFDFAPVDLSLSGYVPYKRLVNESHSFSQLLPATADYVACVATGGGLVDYALTVTIPPLTAVCTAPNSDIRSTNWATVLPSDPALTHEMVGGKDYVKVIASGSTVGGFPVATSVVYGDFDGNCVEEAALPLDSGGTAGQIGYLVYRLGSSHPNLIAWGEGYKLGLSATANRLIVSNAVYQGWEPNCCPSGISYATYRLAGDVLTLVSTTSEGYTGAELGAVEQFYSYLNARDFTRAYAMLSPTFQAANPFASWKAGYDNTVSFTVTVAADPAVAHRLQVTIHAVENAAGGGTVNRTYVGYWDTIWGGGGWLLNTGVFHLS